MDVRFIKRHQKLQETILFLLLIMFLIKLLKRIRQAA